MRSIDPLKSKPRTELRINCNTSQSSKPFRSDPDTLKAWARNVSGPPPPEGALMSRKNSAASIISTASYQSVPRTPIAQMNPVAGSLYMHRFESISSIFTTDDEATPEPLAERWLPEQDELLLQEYQLYVDDPTTTPFSGRFPPSGVLHRVAKNAAYAAAQQHVLFPYSPRAVRQRLLALVAEEEKDPEPANPIPGTVIPVATDDYFGVNLTPDANSMLADAQRRRLEQCRR